MAVGSNPQWSVVGGRDGQSRGHEPQPELGDLGLLLVEGLLPGLRLATPDELDDRDRSAADVLELLLELLMPLALLEELTLKVLGLLQEGARVELLALHPVEQVGQPSDDRFLPLEHVARVGGGRDRVGPGDGRRGLGARWGGRGRAGRDRWGSGARNGHHGRLGDPHPVVERVIVAVDPFLEHVGRVRAGRADRLPPGPFGPSDRLHEPLDHHRAVDGGPGRDGLHRGRGLGVLGVAEATDLALGDAERLQGLVGKGANIVHRAVAGPDQRLRRTELDAQGPGQLLGSSIRVPSIEGGQRVGRLTHWGCTERGIMT